MTVGVEIYSNPGGIIAATVVTQVIALLAVGLRFYSRRCKRQQFIVSDWLIILALIVGAGLAAIEIYGVHKEAFAYPIGATFAMDVVMERFAILKQLQLALILLGVAGTGFVKLSVCFLYWHLFSRVVFRRFLAVWIGIVALWMVGAIIGGLTQCGTHLYAVLGAPEDYFTYCKASVPIGYAVMASDVLTDFVTLIIPIPVVMSLSLDRRTKILTLLTFMVGSLSVGCSIAKTYIYVIQATGQSTEDAILTTTGLSLWNLLEVQIGILAACGPTLRQVLSQAIRPTTSSIKSLLSRLSGGSSSTDTSGGSSQNQYYNYNKDELPSFVKIPEGTSLEALHSPGVMHVAKVRGGGNGRWDVSLETVDSQVSGTSTSSRDEDVCYEMKDVGANGTSGVRVKVTRKFDVRSTGDSMV
ncbi:hypothetical protein QBC37DRAFT_434378 [Rhypophila decipiens]|uniref:Rhodopsin domain-containing protein n=1 Tax=Rhypophila decipiens TaxID=261697 RepID=A0AAN6XTX3_9PEZI|nr:hypothetical protein QBC37DRAFT_434378 [Rhypophila decipiens]